MNIKQLITCLFIAFILSFNSKGAKLTASVSSIDITPPIEMKYTLGGYGERMNKPAEAIHDHIWSKALALQMGTRKYMIITLDLLGIPENVKSDLLKRVPGMGWSMGVSTSLKQCFTIKARMPLIIFDRVKNVCFVSSLMMRST